MIDQNPASSFTLLICGDWAPADPFDSALTADPQGLYGDLLPVLRAADLAVANLESPFAGPDLAPIIKDGVYLRLDDAWVGALADVPFHLVTLANNHIMDYGLAGLARTQSILDDHGIDGTGAGASAGECVVPWRKMIRDTDLVILNVAEGEEARAEGSRGGVAPFDVSGVCERIRSLRAENTVIVVIAHAGREHLPIPAPYIRDAYRAWADAGAQLVVGHHPHVPQGMERWGNGAIYYSLGNFIMWMDSPLELHNTGLCLQVRFSNATLAETEATPFHIHPKGLSRLRGDELESFHARFARLSALITEPDRLEAIWAAFADRWFAAVGVAELVESAVHLAGRKRLLQAMVKHAATGVSGEGLGARLKRKLLWRLNSYLSGGAYPVAQDAARKNAAAILRNRFDTPAHSELYRFALKRVMSGEAGSAPAWADSQLKEWGIVG